MAASPENSNRCPHCGQEVSRYGELYRCYWCSIWFAPDELQKRLASGEGVQGIKLGVPSNLKI
jgi:hypothetical protein